MYLQEIWCGRVDWIHVAENKGNLLLAVNTLNFIYFLLI